MTAVSRLLVRSRLPGAVLRAVPRSTLPMVARAARPVASSSALPARLVAQRRWASSAAAVAEAEEAEAEEVTYPVREAPPLSAADKARVTRQRNIGM